MFFGDFVGYNALVGFRPLVIAHLVEDFHYDLRRFACDDCFMKRETNPRSQDKIIFHKIISIKITQYHLVGTVSTTQPLTTPKRTLLHTIASELVLTIFAAK